MPRGARDAALEALLRMDRDASYSNLALDGVLSAASLQERDRALASALFYGVLEKRITLDWLIGQALSRPDKKVDPAAMAALRLGAYQIFFLERVPDSAAVNESVCALKRRGKQGLSGFVNGVLRGVSRRREELLAAMPKGNDELSLSIRFAMPRELIRLWMESYGESVTLSLLDSFSHRAPTWVRINTRRTSPEDLAQKLAEHGAQLELTDGAKGILHCGGSPAALPEYEEGLFHVQDLSAQLACEAAISGLNPGLILDCCAAPGGKSFTLAQMMPPGGKVLAFDLHPARVGLIQEGAARLELPVEAAQRDMSLPAQGLPQGDLVLCDVPCSGYGVLRRKPEIRYKPLENAAALPDLQLTILKNAAALVRPGGRLAYCTCTLNPRENGEVAQAFLKDCPGFEPRRVFLPDVKRVLQEPEHQLIMFPFAGASDGFFLALFERKE